MTSRLQCWCVVVFYMLACVLGWLLILVLLTPVLNAAAQTEAAREVGPFTRAALAAIAPKTFLVVNQLSSVTTAIQHYASYLTLNAVRAGSGP